MQQKKDYYKILGISSDATYVEIKKAYRKLVHKCHPDIVGNTEKNVEIFKEITEAYETLSSVQKREQYDSIRKLYEYAEKGEEHKTTKSGANSHGGKKTETDSHRVKEGKKYEEEPEPTIKRKKRESSVSKMEEQAKSFHLKNIFTNFVKQFKKGNQQKRYVPPKVDGKDITTEVTLSVEEAINGTERVVNILHMETCDKCHGRRFINGSICPECGGKGEKSKYKKLTVKIPPQVKHNSKVRVEGEGNKGFNGGKRGNLYLIVKIKNAQDIQYDGLNIIRTVTIAPYEAVLGGYITFNMNGETLKMKLMPMTYSGQKYRISEQGIEKNGKKGDLIITVKIDIPKKLTSEEIELYNKLKSAAKKSIRE